MYYNSFSVGNRNKNNNNKKADKERIVMDPAFNFEGELSTKLITTFELAKNINAMFRMVFNDYDGCKVTVLDVPIDEKGNICYGKQPFTYAQRLTGINIWFKANPKKDPDKFTAIEDMSESNNNNGPRTGQQRITAHNNRFKNRKIKLTKKAKELLEDFVIDQKPDWNRLSVEGTDETSYGQPVYLKVTLDNINAIVKTLYGERNSKGERLDYQVNLLKPTNPNPYMFTNKEYLLQILQLNNTVVENKYRELGFNTQNPYAGIVRD